MIRGWTTLIRFALAVAYTMLVLACCGCDSSKDDYEVKGQHRLWSFPLKTPANELDTDFALESALDHEAFEIAFKISEHPGNYRIWVLYLDAEGHCDYCFTAETPTGPIPMRVQFVISAEEVQRFRALLGALTISRLGDTYQTNLADGIRIEVRCLAGGKRKSVYCDNHFPNPVVTLYDYILDEIIGRHRLELLNASPVSQREYEQRFFLPIGDAETSLTRRG